MEAYLVRCSSYDGDSNIALVSKETFDWILQPVSFGDDNDDPTEEDLEYTIDDSANVPEIQKRAMAKGYEEFPDVIVSRGSPDNDKAMLVLSELPGIEGELFLDDRELQDYIRKNNVVIVDSFVGFLY